jgi:hypothetical protein
MHVNSTNKRKHSMISETKYMGVDHKDVRETEGATQADLQSFETRVGDILVVE